MVGLAVQNDILDPGAAVRHENRLQEQVAGQTTFLCPAKGRYRQHCFGQIGGQGETAAAGPVFRIIDTDADATAGIITDGQAEPAQRADIGDACDRQVAKPFADVAEILSPDGGSGNAIDRYIAGHIHSTGPQDQIGLFGGDGRIQIGAIHG